MKKRSKGRLDRSYSHSISRYPPMLDAIDQETNAVDRPGQTYKIGYPSL
jgi:hypothetical protein